MTRAFQLAQAVKLSLILGASTGGLLLGSNLAVYAESEMAKNCKSKMPPDPQEVRRFEILLKADELYLKGQQSEAENLYRKLKRRFSPREKIRTAIHEIEQLPGDAQVYWRNANEGLQQNLESKIFLPLQLLVNNYPEFVNGHLLLAEACQKQPEACKNTAKSEQSKNALQVLERAGELYPGEPDLLKAKIKVLESEERFLEASIAARQFATIFADKEEAPEFEKIADKDLQRHHAKLSDELRTQGIFSAVISAVQGFATNDWNSQVSGFQTVAMLLQGESVLGKSISDKRVEQYRQEGKLIEDKRVLEYVKGIGGRLSPLMGRKFEYEFYVVKDDSLNAGALPGGKVFVNTGAICDTKSEAELAGLLGHEIAHAVLSHGFQKLAQSQFISSLSNVFPLSDMVQEMVGKEHSRDSERQADILGTRVLNKAGYAADGLRNVMVTLNDQSIGREQTSWQSTHPAPAERVAYLENLIEINNYNRYAFEGVKTHKEIQDLLRGESASQGSQDVQPAVSPPPQKPAQKKPAQKKPSRGNSTVSKPKPIRGAVAIASSSQTLDDVVIWIDGGKVESDRNFTINFTIKNNSDRPFGFVPLYSQVVTDSGKKLTTKFLSTAALVPAGQSIKSEVQVLGQPWNSQGLQNLTLVIKESSGGGRLFRVSF